MPSSLRQPPAHLLRERVRAPGYFASVSEAAVRIETSSDTLAVVAHLKEAIQLIGVEVGVFLSCIQDDEYRTCRFLLACDPDWYTEFQGRAWSEDDPWLDYARHHAEAIRARDIPSRTEAQADIVRLAVRFGFGSAVVVPAPVGGGLTRFGMLCLGSADPKWFDDDDAFLAVRVAALPLAASLNRWCTDRAREELLHSTRVSSEDLLLLDLQRRGMTTRQMAAFTRMSVKSINSRFQRINAKLGVPNRKAAARRAAEYGLI